MHKRFLILATGYFVVTMAVAYPWHIMLFHEKYQAMGAFTRGQPIMALGITAVVIQGIVFAYLYPLYYRTFGGGSPVKRGIQFGLKFGAIVWSVMVFATAAKFAIEPVVDFVAYGTVFQLLQFLAVGSAVGLLHGRSQ